MSTITAGCRPVGIAVAVAGTTTIGLLMTMMSVAAIMGVVAIGTVVVGGLIHTFGCGIRGLR